MDTIHLKSYAPPSLDRREILRYAGARGEEHAFDRLLDECLAELDGKCIYRVCYQEFTIFKADGILDLGFMKTDSKSLCRHLAGCESAVVFAATVGVEIDRLIARYGRTSPAKALFFQAIGTERIEALCELFCEELQKEKDEKGFSLRPRFSAGYGDFPLEAQKEIFSSLDCARKIGLTLNHSLMMSPTKSVTALIGVAKK